MTSIPPELISGALPGALGLAVALLLLAVIPGAVVAHTIFAKPRALDVAVLGPPLGFAAVAFATYVFNLVPFDAPPNFDAPPWLPVVLGWVAVMVVCRRGIGSLRTRRLWTGDEGLEAVGVGAATAAVFALYFLQYDRDLFAFTCTHRAVSVAARVPVGEFWELAGFPRLLVFDGENDTHGVVALLSVLPSVLGFLGVRAAYAGLHAGLAAAIHVGARRAGASPTAALVAFAVAALHPALLDAVVDDVNHVSLAASAVAWAVLLGLRQPGAGTAHSEGLPGAAETAVAGLSVGWLVALMVGAWHPFLASIPALLVLAWTGPSPLQRRRVATLLVVGLLMGLLPFAVRHALAFGHPLTLETWQENAATPHTFLGRTFEYGGLLNWPFHDTVVRTPHNPLPVFLHGPLWLAGATGTVLCGVVAVGLAKLPRGVRAAALLWMLPGALFLFPQENWVEVEKMQIFTVWTAPLLLAVGVGVDALRADRRAWAAVGAVVLLGTVAGRGIVEIHTEPDDRLNARWPHLREELPDEIDAALDRAAWVMPWPTWERERRGLAGRLRPAVEDLAYSSWAERSVTPREHMLWMTLPKTYGLFLQQRERAPRPVELMPPKTESGRVVVELAQPWPGEAGPAVRSAKPDEMGVDGFEQPRIYDLRLPWLPYAPTIQLFRSPRAPWDAYVVLAGPAPDMLDQLARDFPDIAAAARVPDPPDVDPLFHSLRGTDLTVAVPEGARLHLVEIVSVEPSRIQRWTVVPAAPGDEPKVTGPHLVRHN